MTRGGGTHLSPCYFGGGTPLFTSQHPPMAVRPSRCPSMPWPSVVSSQGVDPACCQPSPPAPHSPAPFPPPISGSEAPPAPTLRELLFAPFPEKKLGHSLPKMAAAVREPRGHSARARLWEQRWVAVPHKQGCQVLVTLCLWLWGTTLCPVPRCQCSDSGDTSRVEGHALFPLGCMALPGLGDLWWLEGTSNQPRTRCLGTSTFGDG